MIANMAVMAYAELSRDPRVWTVLARWGDTLRRARRSAAISQATLERLSGVDQSQISRFERVLAPRMQAERLARLGLVLGASFWPGECPHEHNCAWRAPGAEPPEASLERYRVWRLAADGAPFQLRADRPMYRPDWRE